MALEKQYKKGILSRITDAASEFARDIFNAAANAHIAADTVHARISGSLVRAIDPHFHDQYMNDESGIRNWQKVLSGSDVVDEDYVARIGRSYRWEDVLNDLDDGNAAVLARNELRTSLMSTARESAIDIVTNHCPRDALDADLIDRLSTEEYKNSCDENGITTAFEQIRQSDKRYVIVNGYIIDNNNLYSPCLKDKEGKQNQDDEEIKLSEKDLEEISLEEAVGAWNAVSDKQLPNVDIYRLIGAMGNDYEKIVPLPRIDDQDDQKTGEYKANKGNVLSANEEIVKNLYEAIDDALQADEFARSNEINTPYASILHKCLNRAISLTTDLECTDEYANGMTKSDYEDIAKNLGKVSGAVYDIGTEKLATRALKNDDLDREFADRIYKAMKDETVSRLYEAIDHASSAYEFSKTSHVETPYVGVINQKIDEAMTLASQLDFRDANPLGKTFADYDAVADKLNEMGNTLYTIVTANSVARELAKTPAEDGKPAMVPKPSPPQSYAVQLKPTLSYIAMHSGALQ